MVTTFAFILLFITVWFDGIPARCLVDTGATATIITPPLASRIGTLGPVLGQDMLRTADNTSLAIRWHRVANIGTNHFGWSDGVIAVSATSLPGIDCVIGTDLLGRQPITLDWQNQEVLPGEGTRNHG